jgi:hypothetical protein
MGKKTKAKANTKKLFSLSLLKTGLCLTSHLTTNTILLPLFNFLSFSWGLGSILEFEVRVFCILGMNSIL